MPRPRPRRRPALAAPLALLLLAAPAALASVGDRLPEFRECVDVRSNLSSPLRRLLADGLAGLQGHQLRRRRRHAHPYEALPLLYQRTNHTS